MSNFTRVAILVVQMGLLVAQSWMFQDMRRLNRETAFNICINQSMIEIRAGVHARSCQR